MSERDGKPNAPVTGDGLDPLAPATEEELAAARRLRDALEDPSIPSADADLANALRAAWSPDALATDELEALVTAAVDPAAQAGAAAVARALEGEAPATPEAELAVALRHAWSPATLEEAEHAAIVQRAVGSAAASSGGATPPASSAKPRNVVVRVVFGASATALALAASVALFVNIQHAESPAAPLARARSTQPLFDEPFRPGEASARIDRIALARASDLRENRFSRWGVKR